MLAKFDPVISNHVSNIQKSRKHNCMLYYLGHIFQNEIIEVLANSIKERIKDLVKRAKYFSVTSDCTADSSYVVRIVEMTVTPVEIKELYLGFYSILDATRKGLFKYFQPNCYLAMIHTKYSRLRIR